MLVKDGQKTTLIRREKYATFLDLFFGLSHFGKTDQGWVIPRRRIFPTAADRDVPSP
jgi:hypothetical protein